MRAEENLLSLFFSVFPPEGRLEGRQGCGRIVGKPEGISIDKS